MKPTCLQTGQRTCHDADGRIVDCAGSGQDAELARGLPWPQPRFDVRGEVVFDALTGLVWSRDASPAEFPLSWDESLAFVAALNRDRRYGHDDWRLPNRRELRSLISHQTRRPALPEGQPFRQVFDGWYWTATTAVISPSHAWYVDLDGGRMFFGGKDQSFMLWPVRGRSDVLPATGQNACHDRAGHQVDCRGSGQDGEFRLGKPWPAPRFEVAGEAVRDRLTGLWWRRMASVEEGALPWDEALACVGRLNGPAGLSWRLPNINELESLVDCDRHSPALSSGHPFRALRDVCWSSTTSLFEPDWAWALYLDKGAVGVGRKRDARFHSWAVADGPAAAGYRLR